MPEYKVSIIVDGKDHASGPLSKVGGALSNIGQIAGGILTAKAITGIATGLLGAGSAALTSYADFERLGMSLQSLSARELLNSGAAANMADAMAKAAPMAKELQEWTQKLAVQSPFDQAGVADAFRTALAYGFTTKESQRLTQATIDYAAASGASSEAMGRITLALGQIKAKGKLAGQEVLQLTEAGLPVRDILAKAFNVTTEELVKMQERGLIPADKAIEAITASLENDFGGAAKRQAGTFSGLLSSLSDIKTIGLRELFGGMFETAQPALQGFTDLLSSDAFMGGLRSLGESVGKFIGPAVKGFEKLLMVASGKIPPEAAIYNLFGKEGYDKFEKVKAVIMPVIGFIQSIPGKLAAAQAAVAPIVAKITGALAGAFAALRGGDLSGAASALGIPPGVVTSITNAINTIKTVIQTAGAIIGPAVAKIFESIRTALPAFLPIWEQLKTLFASLAPIIGGALVLVVGIVTGLFGALAAAIGPFLTGLAAVVSGIVTVVQGVVTTLTGIFQLIIGLVTGNTQIIQTAWQTMSTGITTIINGLWATIVAVFQTIIDTVVGIVTGFVSTVIDFFTNLYNELVGHSIIPDMIQGIIEWFGKLPGEVVAFVSQMITDALNVLGSGVQDFIAAGQNLIEGLRAGIEDKVQAVIDFLASKLEEAIRISKQILGIKSPSKVFAGMGKDLMLGLARGIETNVGVAADASRGAASTVINNFNLGVYTSQTAGAVARDFAGLRALASL